MNKTHPTTTSSQSQSTLGCAQVGGIRRTRRSRKPRGQGKHRFLSQSTPGRECGGGAFERDSFSNFCQVKKSLNGQVSRTVAEEVAGIETCPW